MNWRPNMLSLVLETWRLERILHITKSLGIGLKADLLEFDEHEVEKLDLRMLEKRRWKQASKNSLHAVADTGEAEFKRMSLPTLRTWLESTRLEHLREKLESLGVVETADLVHLDEPMLSDQRLSALDKRHLQLGLKELFGRGHGVVDPSAVFVPPLQAFLEQWRLLGLLTQLHQLGAYSQKDLLDLRPHEYKLVDMKHFEAERFCLMMKTLRDEFDPV
jgi:hypothetical protein